MTLVDEAGHLHPGYWVSLVLRRNGFRGDHVTAGLHVGVGIGVVAGDFGVDGVSDKAARYGGGVLDGVVGVVTLEASTYRAHDGSPGLTRGIGVACDFYDQGTGPYRIVNDDLFGFSRGYREV